MNTKELNMESKKMVEFEGWKILRYFFPTSSHFNFFNSLGNPGTIDRRGISIFKTLSILVLSTQLVSASLFNLECNLVTS